jgi:excisionase family DNA binding protein
MNRKTITHDSHKPAYQISRHETMEMNLNTNDRQLNESTNNQDLLTYREVGKRIGCSERTVWELVRRGDLPAVKYLRNVRIDPHDLGTFIENHKKSQILSRK